MASINNYPTFHYSQPEEYRFSHDSVFLARRVFEFIRDQDIQPQVALDLCAGCGVIGLDILFHLRSGAQNSIREFDFLEIQEPQAQHFAINHDTLGAIQTKCQFILGNYADVGLPQLKPSYDLIVSNPPYFSTEHGKLPVSEFKKRSRFFVDSDLKTLLDFIHVKLSKSGLAFLLVRDQKEHKQDQITAVRTLCEGRMQIQKIEDIRGTRLLILKRILSDDSAL